ncbi:MAG: VOC family protein [Hyphomicrobiaceae bacterium]|nr:VOC family protein [Hyphomicrobiaceae bacterium]MCC0023881.1 VOC family protein [Hyphomicrobiaceae bacterium]
MSVSHIKFTNLPVADQQRAMGFYADMLGFSVVQNSPYGDDGWNWVELAPDGAQTTIVLTKREGDAEMDRPALVLIDNEVAATAERLQQAGVEIVQPVQSAPWDPDVVWCWLRDSEGNLVMLENR